MTTTKSWPRSTGMLSLVRRCSIEYFCLSDDEITLIDDAVDRIMPAVQPHKGTFPEIWKPADPSDRQAYATTLIRNLKDWYKKPERLVRRRFRD